MATILNPSGLLAVLILLGIAYAIHRHSHTTYKVYTWEYYVAFLTFLIGFIINQF